MSEVPLWQEFALDSMTVAGSGGDDLCQQMRKPLLQGVPCIDRGRGVTFKLLQGVPCIDMGRRVT